MSPLTISLWITLVGIVLIFAAIVILWGSMELLVRITTPRDKGEAAEGETVPEADPPTIRSDRKRRAAAAAAAAALAMQNSRVAVSPAPLSTELSAWQRASWNQ
ncbi:MAG: hypothetical protein RBT34_08040 [Anaerolineaceae bacterium]|jgi:Na+-transporting methylmalonyl-CoA/oxaloacetate decarboxylase gamma subunit|nr:hypothetical protein [Anaerolineaceae bacterium]